MLQTLGYVGWSCPIMALKAERCGGDGSAMGIFSKGYTEGSCDMKSMVGVAL